MTKEGTGASTAPTLDTKTKVEVMKIDNEFSDLSMEYTNQEFDFDIIKYNVLAVNSAVLEIIGKVS